LCCYSWGIALNVSLDTLLHNMQIWKEIREKEEEAYSIKAYITNDETSH
jgi:hypothetical protein